MILLVFGVSLFGQERLEVDESIQVFRKIVEVRVLHSGKPVLGLAKDDFLLKLKGQNVPIQNCEWHELAVPDYTNEKGIEIVKPKQNPGSKAVGRKLVFFFQGDFTGQRNSGRMKGAARAKEMVQDLRKDDWVAVFSFVSHMKMHSDWTSDPDQIRSAIDDAFHNTYQSWPSDDPSQSLEEHFDREHAKEIAKPEVALEYLGNVLENSPGTKQIFYVGWGMGRHTQEIARMKREYEPAIFSLAKSNSTVYSLDISQADYHSLEVGMQMVAQETGGTYERLNNFSSGAFDRVLQAVEGYYLITFNPPSDEYDQGLKYKLKLKKGIKGDVYTRLPRFW